MLPNIRQYSSRGVAGLVARVKLPGGTERSVYVAEQSGLDSDDPWVAVCETHGTMVSCASERLARERMRETEWCEECSVEEDEMQPNGKVKASDRIQLSDGRVMTLGEALDAGLLYLKAVDNYPHKHPRYTAREQGGGVYWEIGQKLFESRGGAMSHPEKLPREDPERYKTLRVCEYCREDLEGSPERRRKAIANLLRYERVPTACAGCGDLPDGEVVIDLDKRDVSQVRMLTEEELLADRNARRSGLLPNARVRLPAGVVEASPPDEESRYGREIGTKAKVTWVWLKSKYGKQPERDQVSDRDYFNGVWGKLTILVRPFDHDNQWIDGLRQEFTSDSLRDAQQYGFDLLRDMPEVRGFWISGVLDKYWQLKGTRDAIRVIDLGVYEREAYAKNAKHSSHPTVVEYAVQEMFRGRGKSVRAAAAATAKKLSGLQNMFISSAGDVVEIDPRELEDALWDRMSDVAIKAMPSFKRGKEDWAIDATLQQFQQKPSEKERLMELVVQKLGYDVFSQGLTPNATSYWVWVIGGDDRPKDEGPYGPHDLDGASSYARISATNGAHDRAVSVGKDPRAGGFSIVRRYRRGTGKRVL